MERIKQALERAREARGDKQPPAPPKRTQPVSRRAHDEAPVEKRIVYTETRQIEVSAEHLRQHRVISGQSDPVANYYSVLRTHCVQRMRTNQWRSLAITSPAAGAGKSLTAVNLAISLAREVNQTLLLVDLDLKRPQIRQHFTDEHLPGISDYLLEDRPLHEILFNPGIERLVVLPGHKSLTHSSEMLSSPKMVNLVQEMKARYPSRIVLFDMPPVLACDDVLAFSPYFDAALLVIEEGVTTKEDLKQSLDMLGKTELMGMVLNKAEETGQSYRYGYY
jgi:capsular exopolysaccharide synthesis family protein